MPSLSLSTQSKGPAAKTEPKNVYEQSLEHHHVHTPCWPLLITLHIHPLMHWLQFKLFRHSTQRYRCTHALLMRPNRLMQAVYRKPNTDCSLPDSSKKAYRLDLFGCLTVEHVPSSLELPCSLAFLQSSSPVCRCFCSLRCDKVSALVLQVLANQACGIKI